MTSLVRIEETVYNEIKQRILSAALLPGARLVHRVLARELGVSSVPVMLALRMLEGDGLIVNTPGLGACVRTWSKEEIIDLYHIRAFQEALAARLCAERASRTEIDAISTAADAFRESAINRNTEANIQADINFHMAVVKGAHSLDLERLIENLSIMRCSMRAFSAATNAPRLFPRGVEKAHDPIMKALKNCDPEAAERAGRKHVEDSLASNLKWINEIRNGAPRPTRKLTIKSQYAAGTDRFSKVS